MDKKTIEELKELLLQEKEEIENNISKIAKPVNKKEGDYETNFEEIGTDREDNATEVEQYSDNLSVEVTLEKRLQEIIAALERIANETYGFCENCQKEIPLERLKANPAATTCIKC
jgi:RNA polymerase-binding protein DksA